MKNPFARIDHELILDHGSKNQAQSFQPSEGGKRTAYYYDASRGSVQFLIGLLLTLLCFFYARPPSTNPSWQIATGILGGLAFLTLSVARFYQMVATGPAFVLSPEPLRIPGYCNEWIPWSGVESIARTRVGRIDLLSLKFMPEVVSSATRPIVYRLLGRLVGFRRDRVEFNLRMLECDPDEATEQCNRYLLPACMARREVMIARGERLPGPPPLPAALMRGQVWLTYGLIVLFFVVYAAELDFSIKLDKPGTPSVTSLALLGASDANLVLHARDWWRLFTGPLLHGSFLHLLSNSLVLLIAGRALERLIGWRWTAAFSLPPRLPVQPDQ